MSRKYTVVCIAFSLWTICQTSLHLVFVVYGYFLSQCASIPSEASTILFYLTYFYRRSCKVPVLNENPATAQFTAETFLTVLLTSFSSDNVTLSTNAVVKELLNNTEFFPETASAHGKATNYFLAFIVADAIWITTAVALLMAAVCGIKERLSLAFCVPWLAVTGLVSIFDVAATIQFALDVAETTSFSNWLKFVGVTNTTTLQDLDSKSSSGIIPMAPSLSICASSSRLIVIWIINLVGFFLVLKATSIFSKQSFNNEQQKRIANMRRDSPPSRTELDLDTSAARIKNWQLFYGAVETTSSQNSSAQGQSDRDCNSNSKAGNLPPQESQSQSSDLLPSASGNVFYYAFPDVVDNNFEGNNMCLNELRGQLPWSYTQSSEDNLHNLNRGGRMRGEEDLKSKKRNARRTVRIKSDTSDISRTEI